MIREYFSIFFLLVGHGSKSCNLFSVQSRFKVTVKARMSC